jgi:hypothetical protein
MSRPEARLWPIVYDDCPLPAPAPWLRVVIHSDLVDMRRLAKRAHPRADHSESVAMFQPSGWTFRVESDGSTWRSGNGYLGTMRLCVDRVTTEIVAHECVHAAAHLYRVLHEANVDLGDICGEDEEHFAHHLGSLVAHVSSALHDMNAWA